MVNMHGVKIVPAEESLAEVERLLCESRASDNNERFIRHLEGRREMLMIRIKRESAKGEGNALD